MKMAGQSGLSKARLEKERERGGVEDSFARYAF